ncbi:MAG: c-type cytochrome biogenesis protein CcsB [Thermodesulfobacteriota bacterium]
MDTIISTIISFYLLSTASYVAYLFFQKENLNRIGFYILLAGLAAHSATIITLLVKTGHMPVRNLYETLSIAAWAVAAVFVFVRFQFNLKILGIIAAPLALIIMVIATFFPQQPAETKAIFSNFWLMFHILTIFIADAAFALACGAGILYLVQEQNIKTKTRGFFYKRLPSLELLDSTGYACIIVGFALLTTGLIAGFVYAKSVWGRFWSWDPKEVWSAVTWLVYAALLHERFVAGWRGKRMAVMSIIGFAVLLFTFIGVNFLLKGHHGEFTRL